MSKGPELYDIAIIGGGPGGITAGLYAARGEAKCVLIDKGPLGGTMLLASRYDNFPGYPGGIATFDLAQNMEDHLREFTIDIKMERIATLKHLGKGPLFELVGESANYHAKTVILAPGGTPRRLPAEGADKFFGRGVSTCAVCDGAFYKGKRVAVVGGGDSAVEEGIYLTRFADSVTIVHRRDELRAKPEIQKKAFENSKVHFIWDSVVCEVKGKDKVEGIVVRNVKTNELTPIEVDGIFVYIGSTGNTQFIELPINTDNYGYVRTSAMGETNIPGLFAVGDVRDEPFKQAIVACGQGCQAALMAERYIKTIPDKVLKEYEETKV